MKANLCDMAGTWPTKSDTKFKTITPHLQANRETIFPMKRLPESNLDLEFHSNGLFCRWYGSENEDLSSFI